MAEPLKWPVELSSDDLEDPKAVWKSWVGPEKWRKHSSALLLSTWALKAAAMRVQRSNTSRIQVWMYTIWPKSWFLNVFWWWLKGWPKKVEVMLSATVQSSPKNLGFLFEGQSLYRLVGCQPQGILKYQASRFRCCKKTCCLNVCIRVGRCLNHEPIDFELNGPTRRHQDHSNLELHHAWVVSWIHVLQFPCQIGMSSVGMTKQIPAETLFAMSWYVLEIMKKGGIHLIVFGQKWWFRSNQTT